jgi:hypothetical protein
VHARWSRLGPGAHLFLHGIVNMAICAKQVCRILLYETHSLPTVVAAGTGWVHCSGGEQVFRQNTEGSYETIWQDFNNLQLVPTEWKPP